MDVTLRMDALKLPKPVKGAHRKARKREHDSKMETFRIEVMALDRAQWCCNRIGPPWPLDPPPADRTKHEAAHLVGKGRKPEWKYDPRNGIRLCWQCHDWIDKRNDVGELSADERKVKVLRWWKENRPEYFDRRGWALPLAALENSVALKKVGT